MVSDDTLGAFFARRRMAHRRYAVDAAGAYLHFSGEQSTPNTDHAWHGLPEQLEALQQVSEHAKGYRIKEHDDG